MQKYILATIIFLFGLFLFQPITVSAAWDAVSFTADTNIYLSGIPLTLVMETGSKLAGITIYPTYISLELENHSGFSIISADRKSLIVNPAVAEAACGSSTSSIAYTSSSAASQTVTITPGVICTEGSSTGGTTTVSGGGGGGGGGGDQTPVTTVSTPTTNTGEVTATASGGGQTSVTTSENTQATVALPANAVSSSTAISVDPVAVTQAVSAASVGSAPAGQSIVGSNVFNITAASGGSVVTNFSKNVTITLTYTDTQISGLKESSLKINYWSATESKWVPLTTTVNKTTNTLTANTLHLTYFAIVGEQGEEEEMTIEELQAEVVRLTALLTQLQVQLNQLLGVSYAGCTIASFDRNLSQAITGDDVKCLQIMLNSSTDTQVASSGVGSPGQETTYFGSLTKAAVIKFQNKYKAEVLTPTGLTSGTGYVGPKTREKLNALLLAE